MTFVFSLWQPTTLTSYPWRDMEIFDDDNIMAHWQCMYGQCLHICQGCTRCYASYHGVDKCANTYDNSHRRCSDQIRWKWYTRAGIQLHLHGYTTQLHNYAVRLRQRHDFGF